MHACASALSRLGRAGPAGATDERHSVHVGVVRVEEVGRYMIGAKPQKATA